MAETRPWRGSGVAESASRRGRQSLVKFSSVVRFRYRSRTAHDTSEARNMCAFVLGHRRSRPSRLNTPRFIALKWSKRSFDLQRYSSTRRSQCKPGNCNQLDLLCKAGAAFGASRRSHQRCGSEHGKAPLSRGPWNRCQLVERRRDQMRASSSPSVSTKLA